jgi:glycosyltransferase involved in cell wall biosynthesis
MGNEHANSPAISVVMVVCNVERFLREAIESILGQTFTDFEFIIVDFGSTDHSKTIIAEYAAKDSRVKLHEIPHCGLAEARNAGGFLARGRYIAIMDADDISMPNRLELEFSFMEKHPGVGVVGGTTEWIDATGRKMRVESFPLSDGEIKSALEVHCPFCQPSVLVRSEAFHRVGGYREAFAPAEDYDLWIRVAEHYQCANLSEVVLRYRVHPYQVSFRKRTQQTLRCIAARFSASARKNGQPDPMDSVAEINSGLLTRLGINERVQQTAVAGEYLFWFRAMYAAGEYGGALKAAIEVFESREFEHAERWQVANLRLMTARLYWKQGNFTKGLLIAAHAFAIRPVMLGRPAKQLLRKVQLWMRSNVVKEQVAL